MKLKYKLLCHNNIACHTITCNNGWLIQDSVNFYVLRNFGSYFKHRMVKLKPTRKITFVNARHRLLRIYLRTELEKLLNDVIAKHVSHQVISRADYLAECLLLFSRGSPFKLLLNKPVKTWTQNKFTMFRVNSWPMVSLAATLTTYKDASSSVCNDNWVTIINHCSERHNATVYEKLIKLSIIRNTRLQPEKQQFVGLKILVVDIHLTKRRRKLAIERIWKRNETLTYTLQRTAKRMSYVADHWKILNKLKNDWNINSTFLYLLIN